jgi:IS605 OrfB family transposase
VSLYSVDGRVHARVLLYNYARTYLGWKCKISTLIWDRASKDFYLGVAVEKCSVPAKPGPVLGIDRGLRNVAVCSNNMFFNAARINATRGRYAKNKAELQAKGTRSATRRLRQQSGRERRFVTCENHRISKTIVNTDFAVFALEDLSGISYHSRLNKKIKTKVSGWAFYQLQEFIFYKAEGAGKTAVLVDPTCTSQWCSRCGWIDAKSRNGRRFRCTRCGYELDADLNASRNIARLGMTEAGRLLTNQPHATDDEAGHSGAPSERLSPVASPRIPETVGTRSGA